MIEKYIETFKQKLTENGMSYSETEFNHVIRTETDHNPMFINFYTKNEEHSEVYCCVHFSSFLLSIDSKNYADALLLCNELNYNNQFAKFYISEEMTLTAAADTMVDLENTYLICLMTMVELEKAIDAAAPQIIDLSEKGE